ncbi:hypothetical protein LHP98_00490 [Rhodobacter sp. Har01]|uniref:hypothetical protein n=1 Tax=Rhodobacter sp. Har01 TaxID=2883999 RepID=UPI001D080014|nr:hypothetical protein [Rhodobacter sp. Har01]MCB6176607.1 hypothetical protein [Rhodobacter sp. Har01]
MTAAMPFPALLARLDRAPRADRPLAQADALLAEAETVLATWLRAHGKRPTRAAVEGFRLLALHRQGARGDPSFNACRETCRELVYLRNVVAQRRDDATEAGRVLRLQAMVLRHLALFVGGKLENARLGEFCCASRPLRAQETEGRPGAAGGQD